MVKPKIEYFGNFTNYLTGTNHLIAKRTGKFHKIKGQNIFEAEFKTACGLKIYKNPNGYWYTYNKSGKYIRHEEAKHVVRCKKCLKSLIW